MLKEERALLATCELEVSFPSGFGQNMSSLSNLGFDSLSFSKNRVRTKKVEGTDLSGQPSLFFEMEFCRNKAKITYSLPSGSSPSARKLHATTILLRSLSLVPNAKVEMASICRFVLPSLETALQVEDAPYELLQKKHNDCVLQLSSCLAKTSRIARATEESAHRCAELEAQNSALQTRISHLEAISDSALCELVLEWITTHQGTFSVARFSKQNNLPVSRCEEGLEILLCQGTIRRSGGARYHTTKISPQHFAIGKKNFLDSTKELVGTVQKGILSQAFKKK